MPIAVSHGEGRAEFSHSEALTNLQQTNQIALRYLENNLSVASKYPANPNGSPDGITGVTSSDGRATLMMPHPERVFRTVVNSWHLKIGVKIALGCDCLEMLECLSTKLKVGYE